MAYGRRGIWATPRYPHQSAKTSISVVEPRSDLEQQKPGRLGPLDPNDDRHPSHIE